MIITLLDLGLGIVIWSTKKTYDLLCYMTGNYRPSEMQLLLLEIQKLNKKIELLEDSHFICIDEFSHLR
jgi:hypothetical protein